MRGVRPGEQQVIVDRVACTAHGVCAVVSNGAVELDEFGYPVQSRITLTRAEAHPLVQQCPARALILARHQ
ncbi:ferredoxin [Leekyejoonella antrihumi]|uniref:Ferredoxin n=1 Tax=Leekyejoonella antrihumi TaxID=1660198 RepID=A0A563DUA2_9MICO|nr:ferredoxin [Leekyejoonella antrihumi]TWP33837.1 ferredoxin [Leekyejoonella antrihumi]